VTSHGHAAVHAFVRGTARAIDTNIIDYFDGAARPGLYAVRAPAPAVRGGSGGPPLQPPPPPSTERDAERAAGDWWAKTTHTRVRSVR